MRRVLLPSDIIYNIRCNFIVPLRFSLVGILLSQNPKPQTTFPTVILMLTMIPIILDIRHSLPHPDYFAIWAGLFSDTDS
jgi:hypothetical protein